METDSLMERLEGLQRDLIAFAENRLPTLERLSFELETSVSDLRKFLDRKKKSEASRKVIAFAHGTGKDILKVDDVEYQITEDFRQSVLEVADELDLDEVDAARLCIAIGTEREGQPDPQLPYRALLRFHSDRFLVLDCVRLLLAQTLNTERNYELSEWFLDTARRVIRGQEGSPVSASTFWKRCIDGIVEVESYIQKIADHKQAAIMTGMALDGDLADALLAQHLLLFRQHEVLGAILSHLICGGHVTASDFRLLLSKAATLDANTPLGSLVHYVPGLLSGSAYFGADEATPSHAAKDLHSLFAPGPGQLQWKISNLQAAATTWWLAEYSSRFTDPTNTGTLRVADRQKEEDERTKLFMQSLSNGALHLTLAICQYLRPEVWYDPAKVGLVRFLLEEQHPRGVAETANTAAFVDLIMDSLQTFSDAFIANMPDVLRRLRADEDDKRRNYFTQPNEGNYQLDIHLERFIVILAYAYQDDPDAAQDFWADRDSNLYGFLYWVSQRLPTPRVAAFCELLTSIASNEKTANQAHRFLLEDAVLSAGKLRKVHSVCWAQIFSELDLYASSLRSKPVSTQQATGTDTSTIDVALDEPETYIMLEAYLRLASHICRLSNDARAWILREQTFHIGENLFQLASSGQQSRVHASCFDLLSALLTDKVSEVNDGIWVLLDNWVGGGGSSGAGARSQGVANRAGHSERHYLQVYSTNFETATSLVNLLNALVLPSHHTDNVTRDILPFPENLGAPHRHAGIDAYVDFVMGTAFKSTIAASSAEENPVQVNVLRCACLQFVCACLSTFNEDLVALANTTAVAVDKIIQTSSLIAYARLHPFGRVMDWMFNESVIAALTTAATHNIDDLNNLDPESPQVQATFRSITAINLAFKLQSTYLDIVRPLRQSHVSERVSVASSAFASYDEVLLSQLDLVARIVTFAASDFAQLSLESLQLVQRFCSSKRLSESSQYSYNNRISWSTRIVGKIAENAEALVSDLRPLFQLYDWDLETGEEPLKLTKARAVLDVLTSSLSTVSDRPSLAHCLLGFDCSGASPTIAPGTAFSYGQSLFHAIAVFTAILPYAIGDSNSSWLLALKKGCLEVILKLALSTLTAPIVLQELRSLDLLAALCQNQMPALTSELWDHRALNDVEFLLGSSADAVCDFIQAREFFYNYAALELRVVAEQGAYSVQEKMIRALLGTIILPDGEQMNSASLFDLIDFMDIETASATIPTCRFFNDLDLSACLKDDLKDGTTIAVAVVHQLLLLRKRELIKDGLANDVVDEQQLEDEIRAVVASVQSQNHWKAIQLARISALEAWTDLVSLMTTTSGLEAHELTTVAERALQVVLPRFDRALAEDLDMASLLAKLTLAVVPATVSSKAGDERKISTASSERLLSAFRICLKAITDSGTDLALRDVCYRTCCAVLASLPLTVVNGKRSPSTNARHLLQLIQFAGDRLIVVITEDAFSGRGVTRVSSLLFLDGLFSLSDQAGASSALLRALTKLNFVPVLIDQSIGSVASSFDSNNEELSTTIAYFHTALSLLLKICQNVQGAQLVLNSGIFTAIDDSRLFSTDPDIGLDIDNPVALREFYRLLAAVLRVITAAVLARGPNNSATVLQAETFLQRNRFSMQAVFKRTSSVQKTAGPPEQEAIIVADEFSKLLLVTGFLENDEPAHGQGLRTHAFS